MLQQNKEDFYGVQRVAEDREDLLHKGWLNKNNETKVKKSKSSQYQLGEL
jgi:hypothetical protein